MLGDFNGVSGQHEKWGDRPYASSSSDGFFFFFSVEDALGVG